MKWIKDQQYIVFMYIEIHLSYSALYNFIFLIFLIYERKIIASYVLSWKYMNGRELCSFFNYLEIYLPHVTSCSVLFTRVKQVYLSYVNFQTHICRMWSDNFANLSDSVSKNGWFSCKVERGFVIEFGFGFWIQN